MPKDQIGWTVNTGEVHKQCCRQWLFSFTHTHTHPDAHHKQKKMPNNKKHTKIHLNQNQTSYHASRSFHFSYHININAFRNIFPLLNLVTIIELKYRFIFCFGGSGLPILHSKQLVYKDALKPWWLFHFGSSPRSPCLLPFFSLLS